MRGWAKAKAKVKGEGKGNYARARGRYNHYTRAKPLNLPTTPGYLPPLPLPSPDAYSYAASVEAPHDGTVSLENLSLPGSVGSIGSYGSVGSVESAHTAASAAKSRGSVSAKAVDEALRYVTLHTELGWWYQQSYFDRVAFHANSDKWAVRTLTTPLHPTPYLSPARPPSTLDPHRCIYLAGTLLARIVTSSEATVSGIMLQ